MCTQGVPSTLDSPADGNLAGYLIDPEYGPQATTTNH